MVCLRNYTTIIDETFQCCSKVIFFNLDVYQLTLLYPELNVIKFIQKKNGVTSYGLKFIIHSIV